jgi:hypothetical protein
MIFSFLVVFSSGTWRAEEGDHTSTRITRPTRNLFLGRNEGNAVMDETVTSPSQRGALSVLLYEGQGLETIAMGHS